MLAILLASGALSSSFAYSSSTSNTVQSTSSTLAAAKPTFVGPASKFLSGPFSVSPAFTSPPASSPSANSPSTATNSPLSLAYHNPKAAALTNAPQTVPPTVGCPGSGCDSISGTSGGATSNPLGLNVVDSTVPYSALSGFPGYTVEPPDQGLCANSQYVMEILNIGELQLYSASNLQPVSNGFVTLDALLGLSSHGASGWSSGGDISCVYDSANGGHWFVTEFVSTTPEKPLVPGGQPGPFQGCFIGVLNTCREGIAVSDTNNPKGSYKVYFLDPNKTNHDPGVGYLLNDFTKIATTGDAFLLFYDEYNQNGATIPACPAFGCRGFNGAQEFALSKKALEQGMAAKNVGAAYENMGLAKNLYPLPADGGFQPGPASCFSGVFAGAICWYEVIPAQSPGSQYDSSHGGSGFMITSLDFLGAGDNRVAVFDWTHLAQLNSAGCSSCSGITFGGQIITSGVVYMDEGAPCPVKDGGFCGLAEQKAGPIPLGNNCYLISGSISKKCPEGGIATNGDGATQASYSNGQIWTAVSTAITQKFGSKSEVHVGATFWAVGTSSFDSGGSFSLTTDGYVSAAHEDIEMPAIAGVSNVAVISFTLSGKSYYPSSAYGTLSTTSTGLVGGVIHIVALGKSPYDGLTEYQGFPGFTRPRWGDYGAAVYVPSMGVFFTSEYIQHPNCGSNAFLSSGGTCGGTREATANWGSSVNFLASP